MLESIIPDNATPDDFATRHGWEPYLCRYRGCPRAIQGFNSSVLRQEHENSHAPRFRCSDTACEVLGSSLPSRAALSRHNKKYHDGNSLAAIPTSLRKASVRPHHDRSRFLLREPPSNSPKRSIHVEEEENVWNEVDGATTPAHSIQGPASSTDKEQTKDRIIKCICGLTDSGEGFQLLDCGSCDTAQHIRCYYVNEHGELSKFEDHFCIDCKPKLIDVELATTRQMEQKKLQSEYFHLRKLINRELMNEDAKERLERFQKDMTRGPAAPTLWSALEEMFVRTLICHHETDWVAIAEVMKMRRFERVYNS